MATSPSHILGELIGNFFEDAMKQPIQEFSSENELYFDKIGPRKARKGKKVTWEDIDGNHHDLDYVLERGGTESVIGSPVAFIELAWRRYTKHSKNKVQEISGAITPIVEKYSKEQPFKGAILSGEFTNSSLEQLRSQGFSVLYISFNELVSVFRENGLDIFFDETTSDMAVSRIINRWRSTPEQILSSIKTRLLENSSEKISSFISDLSASVNRHIEYIHVLPLHGSSVELPTVASAIDFIEHYSSLPIDADLQYIEIIVLYSNGARVECHFKTKQQAKSFLSRL